MGEKVHSREGNSPDRELKSLKITKCEKVVRDGQGRLGGGPGDSFPIMIA